MKERIYVAHPYRASSPRGVLSNVADAARLAVACMKKGHYVHCPHTHTHDLDRHAKTLGLHVDATGWLELDFTYLEQWATAILVVGSSEGVDAERLFAESIRLTVFESINDVPDLKAKPTVATG